MFYNNVTKIKLFYEVLKFMIELLYISTQYNITPNSKQ